MIAIMLGASVRKEVRLLMGLSGVGGGGGVRDRDMDWVWGGAKQ